MYNIRLCRVFDVFEYSLLDDGTYSVKAGLGCGGFKTLTIPDEYNGSVVTQISDRGFIYIYGPEEVLLPTGLISIGVYSFQGSSTLNRIDLTRASALKKIGQCAFKGCGSLTSITVPSTITTFGQYTFEKCTSLESATVNSYYIGSFAFIDCTGLSEVNMSNAVLTIGAGAFRNCTSLSEITIPSSVTKIMSGAFLGSGLTSAYFEEPECWNVSSDASVSGTLTQVGGTGTTDWQMKVGMGNVYKRGSTLSNGHYYTYELTYYPASPQAFADALTKAVVTSGTKREYDSSDVLLNTWIGDISISYYAQTWVRDPNAGMSIGIPEL